MPSLIDTLKETLLFFLIFCLSLIYSLKITHYLQRKEYRLDRLKDFWFNENGKKIVLSKQNTGIIISLLISSTHPLLQTFTLIAILLIQIYQIINKGLERPKLSHKIKLILFANLTLLTTTFFLLKEQKHLLVLVNYLQIIVITLVATYITTQIKKIKIKKATEKISKHKNLFTIGITGSFGKSSTKEFLAGLISQKGTTLKTPENINSEIGIANLILSDLSKKHHYFVCEMGAYTKNEIALISKMVKPQIGIITQIGEQHLSLFGSVENIKNTKSELVKNLKKGGIAILNYDNQFCQEIGDELKKQQITTLYYSNNKNLDSEIKNKISCYLVEKEIKENNQGQKLTINLYGQIIELTSPIYAEHLTENLLPAILAAYHAGVSIQTIKTATKSIKLNKNQIQIIKNPDKPLIIDDSYNMNLAGSKAAINLAKSQKQGQIFVVTMGIPELGNRRKSTHEELAKFLIESEIHTFVTNEQTYNDFTNQAKSAKKDPKTYFTLIKNLKETPIIVFKKVTNKDTLVYLNRVPESLKKSIL